MKSALILGVTGQDGSYLADFLLKKGYNVYGSFRRTSHRLFERLEYFDILDKINLVKLDLTDPISINKVIKETQPDELYNLAAQSFVGISFDQPILTTNVNATGALSVFETVKESSNHTKIYQASSSEMFGNSNEIKNEFSRMNPASPYGVSKVFAHKTAQHYREAYGLFATCGILFNHESPLRGLEFVTRKITHNIARIKLGYDKKLFLGNIDAKRDWGFAGDYVKAMWQMLQQDKSSDYVVATGESHSVKDFLDYAFDYSGLGDWKDFVEIDKKYFRPQDIDDLVGDATKAEKELGWKPSITFKKLIEMMVDSDIKLINEHVF
ncbi:GDP-mannose 4,6-dehydratase [Candidatus Nitrosopumilus sp. SW]|uniref:GDP-mannose 4,6-dehydratase n=1 Tax=Candidatus Nitrosopumilus sp. SW TaxID=2508726 RepID=UPI0011549FB8|nr:GDP-mannose 4,6-dehydratase [Candidatus Nitrosopumilus sp. SW]QDI88780.1 GDP-mannose 4,6-dehydratase [Candidatus Nitrosopumilus sp. SW]